jgi:hypothetical protein
MIGMETIVRKQFEARPELAERIGKEKIDEIVRQSATPLREKISYLTAAAGAAIITLVMAGIFAGLLRIFDAPAPYPKILGVSSYVFWAYTVVSGAILVAVIKLNAGDVDLSNPIALNPGFFTTPESAGKRVQSLLTSLDLLSFAAITFLAFGFTRITRGLSIGKALLAVAIPWIVYVVGKMAVTGLLPF